MALSVVPARQRFGRVGGIQPNLRAVSVFARVLVLATLVSLAGCTQAPSAPPRTSLPITVSEPQPGESAATRATTPTINAVSGPGSSAKEKELLKLRVGLGSSPAPALPNSVLWLANDLGYYEREGLDVELIEVQGTPSVITAMRTGGVDVGNISTEEVVKLTATKTLEMRAIHAPDASLYFLVAARDNLGSISDLRGKTFGIARVGSVDHSMTELVFKANGLDPGQVEWVAIGAPAVRAQALAAGRIAATTMSVASWVTIQNERGVKVLLSADDYFAAAPIVQKVDAVTMKVLQEKPEQLRRFTAAIIKASRAFAESKQLWVDAVVKRRPDLERRDVEELWEQFKRSWAVNGLMNLNAYQETAEFLYTSADFKDVPKIQPQDWADTRFVDAVLKDIGVFDKIDEPGRPI